MRKIDYKTTALSFFILFIFSISIYAAETVRVISKSPITLSVKKIQNLTVTGATVQNAASALILSAKKQVVRDITTKLSCKAPTRKGALGNCVIKLTITKVVPLGKYTLNLFDAKRQVLATGVFEIKVDPAEKQKAAAKKRAALAAKQKAESDKKALVAKQKSEAVKQKALQAKQAAAKQKADADKKALVAKQTAEVDKQKALQAKQTAAKQKADADKNALVAKQKAEADKQKALQANQAAAKQKADADQKALLAKQKAEADKQKALLAKQVVASQKAGPEKKALLGSKNVGVDKQILLPVTPKLVKQNKSSSVAEDTQLTSKKIAEKTPQPKEQKNKIPVIPVLSQKEGGQSDATDIQDVKGGNKTVEQKDNSIRFLYLVSCKIQRANVTAGEATQGKVLISSNAPQGGILVTLSMASPSDIIALPESIMIEEGMHTATFPIQTTSGIDQEISRKIIASFQNVNKEMTITVQPDAGNSIDETDIAIDPPVSLVPILTGISLISNTAKPGDTVTGQVALSSNASGDGVIVTLSSSNTQIVLLASDQVQVNAGQSTASFSGVGGATLGATTISAGLGGNTKTVQLTLVDSIADSIPDPAIVFVPQIINTSPLEAVGSGREEAFFVPQTINTPPLEAIGSGRGEPVFVPQIIITPPLEAVGGGRNN